MQIKLLEIRDKSTFIAVGAVRVLGDSDEQRFLLRRSGWGSAQIDGNDVQTYLFSLGDPERGINYDPWGWGGRARTYQVAHKYINAHWEELVDGSVVDVEFILGETSTPKVSERFERSL